MINSLDEARNALQSPLSIPKVITDLQWKFYRPINKKRAHVTAVLKEAVSAIISAPTNSSLDELSEFASARMFARMSQVRRGTASGRFVLNQQDERIAIQDLADCLILILLADRWNGNRYLFSSQRGWGLIEDTVYFLTLLRMDE